MNPYKTSLFTGANDLSAYESFLGRKFYQAFALADDLSLRLTAPEVKDLHFAEKALHGKIDNLGTPILPRVSRLASIPGKDIIAADFAVNAFLDLKSAIEAAKLRGEISSTDSIFKNFDAIGGYFDGNAAFESYIATFGSFFKSYLDGLPSNKKRNFDNFDNFIELFLEFFNFISSSFPFTKSAFIMSNMISNQCSGLMIETAQYDYSSDKEKIKDFYKSRSFNHYKDAAIKHGFLIDKGAPWRLIADIDNPVMQAYINRATGKDTYNESVFFKLYFSPVVMDDLSFFKNALYNLYSAALGRDKLESTVGLNAKNCFKIEVRRRTALTFLEFQKKFSREEWMLLFLKIKNLETKMEYSPEDLRQMAKNAADLNKLVDTGAYLGYINNRFSPIPVSEGSMNYEITKIELKKANRNENQLSEKIKRQVRNKKRTLY